MRFIISHFFINFDISTIFRKEFDVIFRSKIKWIKICILIWKESRAQDENKIFSVMKSLFQRFSSWTIKF
jgi:hypothetical protein